MARPSKFDRNTAVETVMQELWRSGYEANSVKAISEKLGITRSSYYNAFGSRENLFKEALAAYFPQSPDRALYDDVGGRSIKRLISDTFHEACAARAGDPEARGCMAVNSLCELAGGPHAELGAMLVDAVLASAARFETLLRLAVSRGELGADTDVHGKALALQSLLIGINTLSKAVRSEDELWLAARTGLQALGLYEGEDAQL
ncbi:TetR/AcrR family transcriptional regulator [Ferrovibrio sp.]|uniref:TetR/AcrR family transcriptional regulator n=1 Tax=Ferrovibrio sp. TaxID=1917215 RepID=UPI002614EE2A|nr:TetR/AcrR family transcriptional regulator [Ferrovibrio sp.]